MRFLLIPFLMFALSFLMIRTSGVWSTKKNWKRIAIEIGVAIGATVMTLVLMGFIIIVFN